MTQLTAMRVFFQETVLLRDGGGEQWLVQCYRTPLCSSQLLMDIKHGAEEIHKHNWVSGHLQGRSLAPYICVTTHNCHKITCHYWADHMDSTYCCLMASFFKNAVSLQFKDGGCQGVVLPALHRNPGSAYSLTFQTSISVCNQLVKADSLKGNH